MKIIRVGVDLTKNVFQVHSILRLVSNTSHLERS